MWKGIDRPFLTRRLQITGLSLALMIASGAGVRAETVTGADGAAGADCVLPGDTPWCFGGNGADGESVTASGNPAVAIGGDGGPGGFDIPLDGSGGGGNGGSATAVAVESAASGTVTASASATAGRGAWSYSGPSYGGDASASATATSGDVTIAATAWTSGFEFENPGILPFGLPKPYADASATVLSGDVSDGVITFGIAAVDGDGDFPSFGDSFTLSFFDPSYRGELFVNGFDFGFYPRDFAMTIDGPGEFVISGAVPQTSSWAMMLLGFAGLGLAGYRRVKSGNPTRA